MGDVYEWTGDGDGSSWSDADNWDDETQSQDPANQAPGAGDDAEFFTGATLTGGGSVDVLTVEADLTVSGATISADIVTVDDGSIDLTSSATLDVSEFVTELDTSTITVESGSTLDAGGDIAIGLTGDGEMDIESGGSVTTDNFFQIGGTQGATGTVYIDGSTSSLDADSVITVGASGDGTMTLTNDATATTAVGIEVGWSLSSSPNVPGSGTLTIESGSTAAGEWAAVAAVATGATGDVTVEGAGSTLSLTQNLQVGETGVGTLTVESGGALDLSNSDSSLTTIDIGTGSDGTGTITLSDTDLSVGGGGLIAGDAGDGSLDVEDTADVSVTTDSSVSWSVVVGSQGGSEGTLLVDDSYFDASGGMSVGNGGDGTLTVQDGATLLLSSDSTGLDVGTQDGGSGIVDVTGTDSSLSTTGDDGPGLIVGDAGEGDLYVESGAALTASSSGSTGLDVGAQEGGSGTVDVTDTDSSLSTTSDDGPGLIVGDAGDGDLYVESGATLSASTTDTTSWDAVVGNQEGSLGSVTITGTGSIFTTSADGLSVGDTGSGAVSVLDGGTLDVTGNPGLDIGSADGGSGTVTVTDSDSTVSASGIDGSGLIVGDQGDGELDIEQGASMQATTDDPSTYFDAVVGSSGSGEVTVSGTGSSFTAGEDGGTNGGLAIGVNGTGTFTVEDGGTLSVPDASNGLSIGVNDDGEGTLEVTDSGSTVSVSGDDSNALVVGEYGTGTLDIEDGASVTSSTNDPTAWWATVVGTAEGGTGIVTIDGAGSSLTAGSGGMSVGNSGTGTVTVEDGGTLNVTDSEYGLQIGTFADSNGAVTIEGAGSTLNSDGPITVGSTDTGALTVEDGGTVAADDNLVLIGAQDGSSGTVTVDGSGSTLTADAIVVGGSDEANAQLIISDGGLVTASTVAVAADSAIQLTGGELDTDPITISGGSLFGSGTVNGDVTDDGTITASGGLLDLTGDVSGTGSLVIDSYSTLQLDGTLNSGPTVEFSSGEDEILKLTSATDQLMPTVAGFLSASDTIDLTFLGDTNNEGTATLNPTTDVLTVTTEDGTTTIQLATDEDYSGLTFIATPDHTGGTDVTVACYRRNTRILSEYGEVPIESLRAGDRVLTLREGLQPIRWIGRRTYCDDFVSDNPEVQPILIRAGALAAGIPHRDLWVSPEHALYVEGLLIAAHDLVNGVSIIMDTSARDVAYLHLEFDEHQVIFAEGAQAESFIDDASRAMFDNAAEFVEWRSDQRRGPARFCAPRVEEGTDLEKVREHLLARATPCGISEPDMALIASVRFAPRNAAVDPGCLRQAPSSWQLGIWR
jgi:fibronectin-binding autotransporter adhesin